ncbi:RNA polymerase sigma factor SigM [compost metagenome]
MLSYALKRGLAKDRAEDLLQIVFMQIFRKKHLYSPDHKALAWIYVITRSEMKDYRNREIKDFVEWEDSLSQTDDNPPILEGKVLEGKQETEHLLGQLKPKEQEVLRLKYLEELEYDEIAARLQETESNLRQIVSRSLKFLRSRK